MATASLADGTQTDENRRAAGPLLPAKGKEFLEKLKS